MSETIEVRQWGKVSNVSAALFDALGADALGRRLGQEWVDSAMRAGYVLVSLEPTIEHEPRWWARNAEGEPMLMPFGEGPPDVYEFRAHGVVRERAVNEPCEHGSTVELTTMAHSRRVLLCVWCSAELDGGPL